MDANHAEIVAVLRNLGCTVCDLSAVGKGCPDLMIGVSGKNILAEEFPYIPKSVYVDVPREGE